LYYLAPYSWICYLFVAWARVSFRSAPSDLF
jgi:hypothetical protein